ncbi:carboxypeptidase regulatory-like domain-containing protein [Paraflavitalea speifideaquila]|uniref:carboxypeptidase regulatory-like domain-containing protein n=1 Tax=Paraflavitalea speifideaquila TaxID=3076558 RepID=UPI0028E952DF|nr:carboxypeptidase regulatory-like domain-containing protein [Paraflavitalea speifideiaquila]
MKKTIATLVVIIIAVFSLHAVRVMHQSSITGKISPSDGAEVVIAINGTDSLKLKSADRGFSFIVKPGAWKVLVNAKNPYKDATLNADVKKVKRLTWAR